MSKRHKHILRLFFNCLIVNKLSLVKILFGLLLVANEASVKAQITILCGNNQIVLQNGDFIFQDLDCELCEAIESITATDKLLKSFSHVGLVVESDRRLVIIEAMGSKVKTTPIDSFISRSQKEGKPKIAIARLKNTHQSTIKEASVLALSYIGKPYDDDFLMNNEKYYCSELIYECFKKANNNIDFFRLYPMNYISPKTDITNVWSKYFENLKSVVPQNLPGCNPNSIATDEKFEWINYCY